MNNKEFNELFSSMQCDNLNSFALNYAYSEKSINDKYLRGLIEDSIQSSLYDVWFYTTSDFFVLFAFSHSLNSVVIGKLVYTEKTFVVWKTIDLAGLKNLIHQSSYNNYEKYLKFQIPNIEDYLINKKLKLQIETQYKMIKVNIYSSALDGTEGEGRNIKDAFAIAYLNLLKKHI